MSLDNVNLWSATNQAEVKCESAYGSGSCLKAGSGSSYSIMTSTITQPPAYTTPPSLPGDLASGFATNSPIPIP
jgi:rhamnogalacturonan hydrolase